MYLLAFCLAQTTQNLLSHWKYFKVEMMVHIQSREDIGGFAAGPVSQDNKNILPWNRVVVRQVYTKEVKNHLFQVENKVHHHEVSSML